MDIFWKVLHISHYIVLTQQRSKYHCCIVNNTVLGDVNCAIYVEKSVENVASGVSTLDDKSICYANFHWMVWQGSNVSYFNWNLKYKTVLASKNIRILWRLHSNSSAVSLHLLCDLHSEHSCTKSFSAFWLCVK